MNKPQESPLLQTLASSLGYPRALLLDAAAEIEAQLARGVSYPQFEADSRERMEACRLAARILELYDTFQSQPIDLAQALEPRPTSGYAVTGSARPPHSGQPPVDVREFVANLPAPDANGGWEPPLG